MVDVRWHFREMRRGELNQDPMEREFFTAEAINERLVREVVQNSLDAGVARLNGASGDPVRVRFSLGGIHAPLDGISAADYLDGLGEHLKAGLDSSDDFRRRIATRGLDGADMPYLVIEDAGTVGLEGDWQRYDDSDEDPADNEHFYWFFRNVARSGKSDDEGGVVGSRQVGVPRRITRERLYCGHPSTLRRRDAVDGTDRADQAQRRRPAVRAIRLLRGDGR